MIDNKYIENFYSEICNNLGDNYKIILEPKRNLKKDWIEYDQVKWEMEVTIKKVVNELVKENKYSLEKKILMLYEFICLNYVYDANVLYFFKRDITDPNNIKYIAVDWYGRIVGKEWIENRKKHNRRICYEFARFYAKAINELIGKETELEAFMVGDKDNLHYIVGLTGKDYSVLLDLDDFNSIKDLTRLKLGLTIKGINILRDDSNKFVTAIGEFNKNRPIELKEIEDAKEKYFNKDSIKYFQKAIETLNKYNIDSQGFCEYIRALIESSNIEIEKIWKEVKGGIEKRYERCLIFNLNSNTYLLDSIEKTLTIIEREKIDKSLFIFNPEENLYSYFGC